MSTNSYLTPNGQQQFELEIKRSRFITSINHVDGRDAAKGFVATLRADHADANHHCWAMVAGVPTDVYQHDQSDDGEPKGTAGKPMLNVLTHSGLGNIVVVVTRYFGGIKLGAGGLVRAYSRCVSSALEQLHTREVFVCQPLEVCVSYGQLQRLEYWLRSTNIRISNKAFADQVRLTLQVPESELAALREWLENG